MTIRDLLEDGSFWQLSDTEIVQHVGHEFSWALEHLRKAKPSAEVDSAKAAGALGGRDLSPSVLLYGSDYPEVNRTVVSILALKWLIEGDFTAFAGRQREEIRLSRTSWDKLRNQFKHYGSNGKDAYALLVATVVNDVGKDASFEEDISRVTGEPASPTNHDQVALRASKADLMFPLEMLDAQDRDDIVRGLELAAYFNLPQLAQGENVPGSISPILALRDHRRAFDLKISEIILDVAGAAGHADSRSAIAFAEPVFQTFYSTVNALQSFMKGEINTETDCYNRVLQGRSKLLGDRGFRLLSTDDASDRALLRLLLIGRVAERQLAESFDRAFASLEHAERQTLTVRLNAAGASAQDPAVIPYYAPALCTTILRKMGGDGELLTRAIAAFMRFLCRACDLNGVQMLPGQHIFDRDLSFAQEFLRGETFHQNPDSLDMLPIS